MVAFFPRWVRDCHVVVLAVFSVVSGLEVRAELREPGLADPVDCSSHLGEQTLPGHWHAGRSAHFTYLISLVVVPPVAVPSLGEETR